MMHKILIANRGEIASRIIKTIRAMGLEAVAVFDEREKDAGYVKLADSSLNLGTGSLTETFLNGDKIVSLAKDYQCDAIHPGYGFLAENADFAQACQKNNLIFIGPRPETIRLMGDKIKASEIANVLGIPVIPRIQGTLDEIINRVPEDFFPCLIKASAGGGGKGMRKVDHAPELKKLLERTASEALKYFKHTEVYLEKYLPGPRHIEVQILADDKGNIIHLFDRECSLQRRYQKIIEESPVEALPDNLREQLFRSAIMLAEKVGYIGAGTVEFLVDKKGKFYFLEMNTRIQVEHGITELTTGVDIVKEQIAIASGESISEDARKAVITGHAIEARLYAEDPKERFRPSPGKVSLFQFPRQENIRIDTDFRTGMHVLPDFDPMMAKIMAYGENRDAAIENLKNAVKQIHVHGVRHNLTFIGSLLNEPDFNQNRISTHYIDEHPEVLNVDDTITFADRNFLVAAGIYISMFAYPDKNNLLRDFHTIGYWRLWKNLTITLEDNIYHIGLLSVKKSALSILLENKIYDFVIKDLTPTYTDLILSGKNRRLLYSWDPEKLLLFMSFGARNFSFQRNDFLSKEDLSKRVKKQDSEGSDNIHAPLNGKILRVNINNNQMVMQGETILVIESMKMENEIRLPSAALIKRVFVKPGQWVSEGEILAHVQAETL